MKSLRIFTAVWGEKHIGWFEKFCLTSLCWKKNKDALEGATWMFLTKEENIERLSKLVKDSGIKVANVEFLILDKEFDRNPHAAGHYMLHGFLAVMNHCLTYGSQLLIAPPDTIFGDGSIHNMREIAKVRDSVVFAIHTRVLPSIDVKASQLSNAYLVKEAWACLHKTWEEAEDGREKINSYVGGISWSYLDENLYSVCHALPTPYLINFVPEDAVYFRNQIHFGVLDHSWPGDVLVDSERMRVIGSSDAAFMVEVTEPDQNIPPLEYYRADEPDRFWRTLKHNKINKMYRVILRGEA